MNLHYQEMATGAQLLLVQDEAQLQRQFFQERHQPLLTIAWNRGPAQTVWVDEVPYALATDQFILLVVNHSFRFSDPAQITAWRFNRDFYCIIDHDAEVGCVGLIFYGMPSPFLLQPGPEDLRKIGLLTQVFVEEFNTPDNIQGEMLRSLLKRLIIVLTRLAKTAQFGEQPPADETLDLLRQFNLLVEKNYAQLHQVQDYADLLHKSPKTLSNLFRQFHNKTPLQVIRERIALEAKRRLRYTEQSVSEVAYALGFAENAHFSRFFKQLEGMSPQAYRTLGKNG